MDRDAQWQSHVDDLWTEITENLDRLEAVGALEDKRVLRAVTTVGIMKERQEEADALAARYPDADSRMGRRARKAQDACRENLLGAYVALAKQSREAVSRHQATRPAAPVVGTAAEARRARCVECGSTLEIDWVACPKCGAKVAHDYAEDDLVADARERIPCPGEGCDNLLVVEDEVEECPECGCVIAWAEEGEAPEPAPPSTVPEPEPAAAREQYVPVRMPDVPPPQYERNTTFAIILATIGGGMNGAANGTEANGVGGVFAFVGAVAFIIALVGARGVSGTVAAGLLGVSAFVLANLLFHAGQLL